MFHKPHIREVLHYDPLHQLVEPSLVIPRGKLNIVKMVILSVSEVVSFKVPREVKEKMRKYSKVIKWSRELRAYVIERIKALEREENLRKVMEIIESTRGVPRGFSTESVREDRES